MNINKNDSYFEADNITILSKIKPVYGTDELLNSFTHKIDIKILFYCILNTYE